ncbi:MAG: hypothetical protein ACREC9_08595 [Methylocella sp.]
MFKSIIAIGTACLLSISAASAASREPYEVKVDPPVCEITVVKEVYHSACGTKQEDYGPGIPADGDAWGCDGADTSDIAYVNGKFQNGEYAYVPAMENSRAGDRVRLCLVSFLANCPPAIIAELPTPPRI